MIEKLGKRMKAEKNKESQIRSADKSDCNAISFSKAGYFPTLISLKCTLHRLDSKWFKKQGSS